MSIGSFNRLTDAEAERLAMLAEECGEVIQAVGKILRHGYHSKHPDGGCTNRELLQGVGSRDRMGEDAVTAAKPNRGRTRYVLGEDSR